MRLLTLVASCLVIAASARSSSTRPDPRRASPSPSLRRTTLDKRPRAHLALAAGGSTEPDPRDPSRPSQFDLPPRQARSPIWRGKSAASPSLREVAGSTRYRTTQYDTHEDALRSHAYEQGLSDICLTKGSHGTASGQLPLRLPQPQERTSSCLRGMRPLLTHAPPFLNLSHFSRRSRLQGPFDFFPVVLALFSFTLLHAAPALSPYPLELCSRWSSRCRLFLISLGYM